uniref:Uncharacterized protein n=1 Tax=Sphaerodactylus townsendi TaxID=933632 RepID=A0ACB8EWV1_9SAUR
MDGQPANTQAVATEVLSNITSTAWIHSQLVVSLTQWKATTKFICSISTGLGEVKQFYERRNVFWDYAVTSAEICGICNETEEEYSQLTEMDGAWNRVSTYLILFLLALFYGGLVTFFKIFNSTFYLLPFPMTLQFNKALRMESMNTSDSEILLAPLTIMDAKDFALSTIPLLPTSWHRFPLLCVVLNYVSKLLCFHFQEVF